MAEGIAFDLVTGVLGKLGSALWDEIGLLRSFKDDVKDLESNLSAIQAVLLDAEERSRDEKESHALRNWLRKLKGAAYDIDDLLDEIQTQALLRKQQREVQNQNQLAKNVCAQFLSCANPINLMFKFKMARRMKELRANINKIAKQRDDFGLVQAGPRRQTEFKRPETTTSVFDEKKIVGRDDDKEKIVNLLLDTNGDHDVSVISIVGLGGLGKTTLAQLVFNDKRVTGKQLAQLAFNDGRDTGEQLSQRAFNDGQVQAALNKGVAGKQLTQLASNDGRVTGKQRFDLRVWVCVSTDFDMKTIAKAVTYVAQKKCVELDNPEAVAEYLVEIFSQHRFLLVLDDVWNEDPLKWDTLKVIFKDGKKGSKILVTTRNEKVAEIMKTTEQPHILKGLSEGDCWELFRRLAFMEEEENDYPSLVAIGKQMAKECGGVPLAAKALGGMMGSEEKTEAIWSDIKDSQIWMLEKKKETREEDKILPSLKLSYIHMPSSALKECFAYCSIFPKGYEIDKDDLIQQWIALGFISSTNTSSTLMEDIGNKYFKELLRRSFLQDMVNSKEFNGKVTYRMHDLVHDLAESVARDEVSVILGEESARIQEGCRYASIYSRFVPQVPTTVMRRLRAFQYSKSPLQIWGSAPQIRESIQYSGSPLQIWGSAPQIRESIQYSESPLQIWGSAPQIRESTSLTTFLSKAKCLRLLKLDCDTDDIDSMLPISIGKLKLLRYLDLSETNIQVLPESITGLCNLQALNLSGCQTKDTLPKFVFHLKNLRYLDLSNLDYLKTLSESIESLQNLCFLDLSSCRLLVSLPSTLCHLKNLHHLHLSHLYVLQALPESIESLQNLRILNISECPSLQSLPSSLSDLRHLEKLDITGCDNLCELPKMIQNLTKLRELLNADCPKLKGMPRGIGKLVSLQKLPVFVVGKQDRVEDCASISELENLKLDGELEIQGLKNVTKPVDAKAANLMEKKKLQSLTLKWNVSRAAEGMDTILPAEVIDAVLENLQPHQNLVKLVIEGYGGGKFPSWLMNKVGSIANLGVEFCGESDINASANKFPALTTLELSSMSVPQEWVTMDDKEGRGERVPIFPRLTQLTLLDCPHLKPVPSLPPSVEDLAIFGTNEENLSSILDSETPPDVQLPNKGLRRLEISHCQQVTCWPKSLQSLTSLQSLQSLTIRGCDDLERIEDWLGELTKLQFLYIHWCKSLRYLPAHKMTTLTELHIYCCPRLFNANGQFVDTRVDHIKIVQVDFRNYKYKK